MTLFRRLMNIIWSSLFYEQRTMDKRQKIALCFQGKIAKVPSPFTVQKCIDRMLLSNHLEDLQEALAGPGRLSGMPSGSSRTLARLIFQILDRFLWIYQNYDILLEDFVDLEKYRRISVLLFVHLCQLLKEAEKGLTALQEAEKGFDSITASSRKRKP